MPEPTPENTGNLGVTTSSPGIPEDSSDYSPTVASKKAAWGLGKLVAAIIASPVALDAFQSLSRHLQPLGITLIVDPAILSKTLPPLIFTVLLLGHDWVKLKYPNLQKYL